MELLGYKSLIFYMKYKGIKFEYFTEEQAINFLQYNNYYFKLSNYKDNFNLNLMTYQNQIVNRYTNLDFFHLVDLSRIDMQLRYLILKMCLDIEHALKVWIMREVTDDRNEDGVTIVDEFVRYYNNIPNIPRTYNNAIDMISYISSDRNLRTQYRQYSTDTPLWFFIEHAQFGHLSSFIEFLNNNITGKNYSSFNSISKEMKYVKNIRNKAAHNAPILNTISISNQIRAGRWDLKIYNYAKRSNLNSNQLSRRLTNHNTHDLTGMLYVFDQVILKKERKIRRKEELINLIERCKENRHIYDENLKSVFRYFDKIVDIF